MKILVAVDGSTYTKRMLAYLAVHDEWLGPSHQYTVVYSTPNLPPRAKAYFDRETLRAYTESEFEKVFKPIRAFFMRRSMDVTFAGKSGPAAEVIAGLAQQGKFDLLVMGSHGHGALGNLVIGSVATKVVAMCTTPILIVR
ncbi:MAG: universal stress protein [Rhodoferax sp.]|nr:universal stress protein [Rhodoferax sp.]